MANPKTPKDYVNPKLDDDVQAANEIAKKYREELNVVFDDLIDKKVNVKAAEQTIKGIAKRYEAELRVWLADSAVEWYKQGLWLGVSGFVNAGQSMKYFGWSDADKKAVTNQVDSIWLDFAKSVEGVKGSALQAISETSKRQARQELAKSFVRKESLKKSKDRLIELFESRGYSAVVDRGGRQWSLNRYTEMLSRTKRTQTANLAVTVRNLENGNDLVQVSNHNSKHPACAIWETKVLSLTGGSKEYPSVDEAEGAGLMHPNCQHRYYPYHEVLAGKPKYNFTEEPDVSRYFKRTKRLEGTEEDFDRNGIYERAFNSAKKAGDKQSALRIAGLAPKKVSKVWTESL